VFSLADPYSELRGNALPRRHTCYVRPGCFVFECDTAQSTVTKKSKKGDCLRQSKNRPGSWPSPRERAPAKSPSPSSRFQPKLKLSAPKFPCVTSAALCNQPRRAALAALGGPRRAERPSLHGPQQQHCRLHAAAAVSPAAAALLGNAAPRAALVRCSQNTPWLLSSWLRLLHLMLPRRFAGHTVAVVTAAVMPPCSFRCGCTGDPGLFTRHARSPLLYDRFVFPFCFPLRH